LKKNCRGFYDISGSLKPLEKEAGKKIQIAPIF
jgi:hypothetical protein